jgi:hypothetical protein
VAPSWSERDGALTGTCGGWVKAQRTRLGPLRRWHIDLNSIPQDYRGLSQCPKGGFNMRMMARFSVPVQDGNEFIKSGKIANVFETLMGEYKPEAIYFYPEDGRRGGMVIFDMDDVSGVAGIVERLSFGLNAKVELVPVMAPADLQKGLGDMDSIIKKYG